MRDIFRNYFLTYGAAYTYACFMVIHGGRKAVISENEDDETYCVTLYTE